MADHHPCRICPTPEHCAKPEYGCQVAYYRTQGTCLAECLPGGPAFLARVAILNEELAKKGEVCIAEAIGCELPGQVWTVRFQLNVDAIARGLRFEKGGGALALVTDVVVQDGGPARDMFVSRNGVHVDDTNMRGCIEGEKLPRGSVVVVRGTASIGGRLVALLVVNEVDPPPYFDALLRGAAASGDPGSIRRVGTAKVQAPASVREEAMKGVVRALETHCAGLEPSFWVRLPDGSSFGVEGTTETVRAVCVAFGVPDGAIVEDAQDGPAPRYLWQGRELTETERVSRAEGIDGVVQALELHCAGRQAQFSVCLRDGYWFGVEGPREVVAAACAAFGVREGSTVECRDDSPRLEWRGKELVPWDRGR